MWQGKTILVTAGPTYEPIDPVRFIGNRSSGKMGFALAEEFAQRGAHVILITGPVAIKSQHKLIERVDVETAGEMYKQCMKYFPNCDVAILAAAVADFTPISYSNLKIKKSGSNEMVLQLIKTKDILAELGKLKNENQLLVGFSLETHNEKEFAMKKLQSKNLDFIVLNSLKDDQAGFGYDTNTITILDKDGRVSHYPNKSKSEVATDIMDYCNRIAR